MFYFKRITWLYCDFLNACKNLYRFRRAIWKAKPWDYSGIYYVLQGQLQAQLEGMSKYSQHTCKDKSVRQMKICLFLLDRLIKGGYATKYQDFKGDGDIFDWKFIHKYDLPKGNSVYKLEYQVKKSDQELLFKILKKHHDGWWN